MSARRVLLFEFEIRYTDGSIFQLYLQLIAISGPRFVCLPDIDILICQRIEGKTARSRSNRFIYDGLDSSAVQYRDRDYPRISAFKDVKSHGAAEAEFYGNGASGLDYVHRREIIDRLGET